MTPKPLSAFSMFSAPLRSVLHAPFVGTSSPPMYARLGEPGPVGPGGTVVHKDVTNLCYWFERIFAAEDRHPRSLKLLGLRINGTPIEIPPLWVTRSDHDLSFVLPQDKRGWYECGTTIETEWSAVPGTMVAVMAEVRHWTDLTNPPVPLLRWTTGDPRNPSVKAQ